MKFSYEKQLNVMKKQLNFMKKQFRFLWNFPVKSYEKKSKFFEGFFMYNQNFFLKRACEKAIL